MAQLRTADEIEKWIGKWFAEGRGDRESAIEHLRKITITPGLLRDRDPVLAWLREQERRGQIAQDTLEHDFMRRQTVAAEASADAARQSARWAAIGAFIAIAAVVATAWPYFKLIDVLLRLAR